MYVKLVNGVPESISFNQIRQQNPDVSLSRNPSNETLATLGYYLLVNADMPSYDPATQRIEEGPIVETNGVYSTSWTVRNLTAEELAARIPKVVSMRQARLALHQQGLLTTIDAAVAQMDTAAQIEWEYAAEIRRDHPLVQQIATALNWTETDLDNLFILAVAL